MVCVKKKYLILRNIGRTSFGWLIIFSVVVGCSSRPSNSNIEQAVRQSLKETVPRKELHYEPVCGKPEGNPIIVEKLKVLEIGFSIERTRSSFTSSSTTTYWPVVVEAEISCYKPALPRDSEIETEIDFLKGMTVGHWRKGKVEEKYNYLVGKDQEGDWTALSCPFFMPSHKFCS